MEVDQIINRIVHMRRDAENTDRDHIPGIDMLRMWLRGLHMDVIIGHDAAQDLTQDEIAARLGENPRGHLKQFRVQDGS